MRKSLMALLIAAASGVSGAAAAQPFAAPPSYGVAVTAPAIGAVTGTVVGLGVSEGWWGSAVGGGAVGAVAAGAVAGIGTMALIHAASTPCQGFHALFGGLFFSPQGCVDGRWVGAQAVAPTAVRSGRVLRGRS